jgi:hypothetical protein
VISHNLQMCSNESRKLNKRFKTGCSESCFLTSVCIYNPDCANGVMVLVDKKILGGGLAMMATGLVFLAYLSLTVPLGVAGMTEEEVFDLVQRQQQNRDLSNLAGLLVGIGFLLILISFGARRKKGGAKPIEIKPAE